MSDSSHSVQPLYIFGTNADSRTGLLHLDESRVAYAAGHYVALYNSEDCTMEFIPGQMHSAGITAIAISPLRRLLGVAERGSPATISVFDAVSHKNKGVLCCEGLSASCYDCLGFAPGQENRFLVALGGAVLYYCDWVQREVLTTVLVGAASQVSFSIFDYKQGLVATGKEVFKWLRMTSEGLTVCKSGLGVESTEYISHSWLNAGGLVVGTAQGELLVLNSQCEYLVSLQLQSPGTCIIPSSRGFIVGTATGEIYFFTASETAGYTEDRRVTCTGGESAGVLGLSLSYKSETSLVILLESAQLLTVDFTLQECSVVPLPQNSHSGVVHGLAVCARKSLIMTCSADHTVRVWDYLSKTLEIQQKFAEEPLSVALHPTGFSAVIGFSGKLRVVSLSYNSITIVKDLPMNGCTEVAFSHGGHLFAATNGALLRVFKYYTGEHLEFKVNKARCLAFSEDDTTLLYGALDGSISEYKLSWQLPAVRTQEFHFKGVPFNCVLSSPDGTVLAVAGDATMRVLSEDTELVLSTGSPLSHFALAHCRKLLFAGLAGPGPSTLRCYKASSLTEDFTEYVAHSSGIKKLAISYDDAFVFTVGQDGCVIMWDVTDPEVRASKRERAPFIVPLAQEVLTTERELAELEQQLKNNDSCNKNQLGEAKVKFDIVLQGANGTLGNLNNQLKDNARRGKGAYESLLEEKRLEEQRFKKEKKRAKDEFALEKQRLGAESDGQFAVQLAKYKKLLREKENQEQGNEAACERLNRTHQRELAEQGEKYNFKVNEENKEVLRLQQHNERLRKELALEQDFIVLENTAEYKEVLDVTVAEIRKRKGEIARMHEGLAKTKQRESSLTLENDRLSDDLKAKKETHLDQKAQTKEILREIAVLKDVIAHKDAEIRNQEKDISELKKQNEKLAKSKFAHDYEITLLKDEIAPREDEIAQVREDADQMHAKLKELRLENEQLA